MELSDFDYDLPAEQIAQVPLPKRDASRLLVLPRRGGPFAHHGFSELPAILEAGDLLVFNDTRVFPARLRGTKVGTGGRVEALLLEPLDDDQEAGRCVWRAICGSSKPLRVGGALRFGAIDARVKASEGDGVHQIAFEVSVAGLHEALEAGAGEVPLPPYIHRDGAATQTEHDRERYQTVYARERGAVAAPTAGLHFCDRVFQGLEAAGITRTFVTLHVGPGTFLPVRGSLAEHRMHEESYEVSVDAVAKVEACRHRGGRVICVGTTSLRALETAALEARSEPGEGLLRAGRARTRLFVRPGHTFSVVDGLLTNFHLPRSTLLMLVSALADRERVLLAYREAITRGYRFYSYGDAMLLL